METLFMNTENSKTSEPNKFFLNLLQTLDLRSLYKHVSLQNLFIYQTWENVRQQYKNSTLKIITSTWDDELELPDGSYSVQGTQDYIEYIIKSMKNMKHYPLILLFIFTSTGLVIDQCSKQRMNIRQNYKRLTAQKMKFFKSAVSWGFGHIYWRNP